MNTRLLSPIVGLLGILSACSASSSAPSENAQLRGAPMTDEGFRKDIVAKMHASLLEDIDTLCRATAALRAAAPSPKGRGWSREEDGAAIQTMKTHWLEARVAYEHIEGAVAPLFPDIDGSIDARYDDFMSDLGGKGDDNLFDGTGVTGFHAVERILWSDTTPESVREFERSLPGFKAAAFPATEGEATDFREKLAAKLVADAEDLKARWAPQRMDLGAAFQGLISLVNEQREKVNKASTNEEESRYAQNTMNDIRANLEGTQKIYGYFGEWLMTKANPTAPAKDGPSVHRSIVDGLKALHALYEQYPGSAVPAPPSTWSAEAPSAVDLDSPFGRLYRGVHDAVDPARAGSVVNRMNAAAEVLGFPEFKVEGD